MSNDDEDVNGGWVVVPGLNAITTKMHQADEVFRWRKSSTFHTNEFHYANAIPYYHILRLRADLLVLKVLLDVLLSSPRRPRCLIIPIVWFHSNNLYKLITTR